MTNKFAQGVRKWLHRDCNYSRLKLVSDNASLVLALQDTIKHLRHENTQLSKEILLTQDYYEKKLEPEIKPAVILVQPLEKEKK
jgi:hypothetical protein